VRTLEDEKWEKFKKKKLGALINETYWGIIFSIDEFTDSATRILKSKTSDMWEGFKRGVWDYYYISRSVKGEPLILLRAAFKDEL